MKILRVLLLILLFIDVGSGQVYDNNIIFLRAKYSFNYLESPFNFAGRNINVDVPFVILHNKPAVVVNNNQLLFACDGGRILNRKYSIMKNSEGLRGHPAFGVSPNIALRQIADTTKYFIFTGSDSSRTEPQSGQLFYSEVDLEGDNGDGEVVSSSKNTYVNDSFVNVMSYTTACDGYWFVTRNNFGVYHSYKINKNGLAAHPVISTDGYGIDYKNRFVANEAIIDFNHDGTKLLASHGEGSNFLNVFNFDKLTGKLSDKKEFLISTDMRSVVALAFDRLGNTYYFSEYFNEKYQIVQVVIDDALKEVNRQIIFKGVIPNRTPGLFFNSPVSDLKVGADNNLYFNIGSYIIKWSPNTLSLDTLLDRVKGVDGIRSIGALYFPQRVAYFPTLIRKNTSDSLFKCRDDYVELYSQRKLENVIWNNTIRQDTLKVSTPGRYTMTANDETCTYYDTVYVINKDESLIFEKQFHLCGDNEVEVQLPSSFTDVMWKDGINNIVNTRIISKSGTFQFQATIGQCTFIDSILVSSQSNFQPLPDTILCPFSNLSLTLDPKYNNIVWSDDLGNYRTKTFDRAGVYSYEALSGKCKVKDTFEVRYIELQNLILQKNEDTLSLCPGQTLFIESDSRVMNPIWDDQISSYSIIVKETGWHIIRGAYQGCKVEDSIFVKDINIPTVKEDQVLCDEGEVIFTPSPHLVPYARLDSNNSPPPWSFYKEGIYTYTIQFSGCTLQDTIKVVASKSSNSKIRDTLICANESFTLVLPQNYQDILWNDGNTQRIRTLTKNGKYNFNAKDGSCIVKDTFQLGILPVSTSPLKNEITLCEIDSLPYYKSIEWAPYSFPLTERFYKFKFSDSLGCSTDHQILIKLSQCEPCDFILPNIMKVDMPMQIYSSCESTIFDFFLYDRWGNLVYKGEKLTTSDKTITIDNSLWVDGVYSYRLDHNIGDSSRKVNVKFGTIIFIK